MIKYIISSGSSVVSEIIENSKCSGVKLSIDETPLYYERFGDAMTDAIKVNKILGTKNYKVMSITSDSEYL